MPQPQITYTTPKVDRHGDHTHIEFVLAEIHHLRGEIDAAPGGCELAHVGCPCGGAVDHTGAGK